MITLHFFEASMSSCMVRHFFCLVYSRKILQNENFSRYGRSYGRNIYNNHQAFDKTKKNNYQRSSSHAYSNKKKTSSKQIKPKRRAVKLSDVVQRNQNGTSQITVRYRKPFDHQTDTNKASVIKKINITSKKNIQPMNDEVYAIHQTRNSPLEGSIATTNITTTLLQKIRECYGDNDAIKKIVKQHFSPLQNNCRDAGLVALITYAARHGLLPIFQSYCSITTSQGNYSQAVNMDVLLNQALETASSCGHVNIVSYLLHLEGFDPKRASEIKSIRSACEKGHLDIVDSFFRKYSYTTKTSFDLSFDDNICVRLAARFGHTHLVHYLLTQSSASNIDPSTKRNEALRFAASFGHTKVVQLLLKDERVNPADVDHSALRFAASNGHLETVRILLQDRRVSPSALNNAALCYASAAGHTAMVKLLLEDDRVNPSDKRNQAIRVAAMFGHVEIVKILLADQRVDPTARDNQAIKKAAKAGHVSVVECLLLHDPRERVINALLSAYHSNDRLSSQTSTTKPSMKNMSEICAYVLQCAAVFDNLALVKKTLELISLLLNHHDEDVAAKTSTHFSKTASPALIDVSLVQQSSRHHYTLGVLNEAYNESFRLAASAGHTKVLNLLLQFDRIKLVGSSASSYPITMSCANRSYLRMDPGSKDNEALRLAASHGHVEVVHFLLHQKLVDSSAMDYAALKWARLQGHNEVVELLLSQKMV